MSIAYYSQTADARHWDSLWQRQQLERLLSVAHRDPLTSHLEKHLPAGGVILEGGCGLGQYVVYFRNRGYRVIGGDLDLSALRIHRQTLSDSPLLGLDLRRIPVAEGTLGAHISIGVVEDVEEGPQELLREFYRTLAPGGILLLSVSWVNGYRRLTRPLIARRQARCRAKGARFYQYALARHEIRAFLAEAGFRVRAFHLYSPARGMWEVPLLGGILRRRSARPAEAGRAAHVSEGAGVRRVWGARRFLYWSPVLWPFAHMILAVAQKPES